MAGVSNNRRAQEPKRQAAVRSDGDGLAVLPGWRLARVNWLLKKERTGNFTADAAKPSLNHEFKSDSKGLD
jgi:hypothetical protein